MAAGNIAIPLINALTAEVAKTDAAAAGYIHWGATSQDVIDTALVLELRAAIDALIADLDRAIAGFTTLAARHRRTATVARTWMQHAVPMPFGLKLAGYAAALARSRERLQRLRREALVLQFGGAAGTLAALGDRGLEVAERLAALLDLPLPEAPWHSHRDRLAEVAAAFAILTGTCGKIARDVSLLMQTEVAEAFEPAAPGRGGSSTMPHKRNPTAAATALAAATHRSQSARDHLRRAGAGARARTRRLAGGMAGVSRAGARHLRRPRCHRRHCGRARSRRSAHAGQPRRDAGTHHGRGGLVRARVQARQARGAWDRRRRPAARPPPPGAICRT